MTRGSPSFFESEQPLRSWWMSGPKKQIVYKSMRPIKVLIGKPPIKETTIPVGSVLVWNHSDLTGEMAHVSWLQHRINVKEVDLFSHCEQITNDSDLCT